MQEDQAEAFSILRGERLFDCLSEDQLNQMVNQARLKLFGRGEPVIEEGAAGDSMFVMLRGAANVFVSKNGSKIQVATLGAGDCFGEMSLLTGEPRSATVRADGDCYVMEIGKPVMAEVLRDAPGCLEQLSELLAQRKMETEGILKEAGSTDEHALKERQYTANFLHRLRDVFPTLRFVLVRRATPCAPFLRNSWTEQKSDYRASGDLEQMSEERSRAEYSGKSLRILVVEDHSDTLEALSRLLNHFGHDISTADDARSALDMINSKEFDVVLCDIALPDGNGYDVIAEAKRKRAVKAVAISGFAARDDIERGRKAGFDFHLAKPVDFHELRSVLGQIAA